MKATAAAIMTVTTMTLLKLDPEVPETEKKQSQLKCLLVLTSAWPELEKWKKMNLIDELIEKKKKK